MAARKVPFYDDRRFIRRITLLRDSVESFDVYPYSIPAIRKLRDLEFDENVTFFVGENGSGKSTLVEVIARKAGFNAEGGTKNFSFSTREDDGLDLDRTIRIARGTKRERDGFYLRAESFFNAASYIDRLDADPEELGPKIIESYGGRSLHEQSHGESFMALVKNRFGGNGLYILDEPEAALSPSRQLALLSLIDILARKKNSQFIIATHSPILLGYSRSTIYELSADGMAEVEYKDTEHYKVTLDFLSNRSSYLRHLCADASGEG